MRFFALALFAGLTACSFSWGDDDKGGPGVVGVGGGTQRTYPVTGFSGVDLRGADDVDVRVGTAYSVRAEGPAKELDSLRIMQDGDTLQIGRRHTTGIGWGHHDKVRIFVTLPRLAVAGVAGSGTMAIDRVEGAKFVGELAGSGDLKLAAMNVDAAEFSIAGSGDVSAAGTARSLDVDIAGSGNLDAPGLHAQRADVDVAGSGDVRALVAGPAKVDIMGSGDVDLGPQAKCTVSKMGSGSARCR